MTHSTGHGLLRILAGVRLSALRAAIAMSVLGMMSAGCATWSGHGVTVSAAGKLRIAVLPVQDAVEVDRLSDIETLPEGVHRVPGEKDLVKRRMQKVTEKMTESIVARLQRNPDFDVIPRNQLLEALASGGGDSRRPLTTGQLKQLGAELKVPAVMTVRLSGYGHLKKRWVVYLIGTGIAEGIVEGVVAGGATKSLWVGLVVGGEEIIQELLTWGGGAYLFNRYYAPVTMEGSLVSTSDGEALWTHTAFDSIDRKALKRLPKEEQKKKEVQLAVTASLVEGDLVGSFEEAVRKNLGIGRRAGPPARLKLCPLYQKSLPGGCAIDGGGRPASSISGED